MRSPLAAGHGSRRTSVTPLGKARIEPTGQVGPDVAGILRAARIERKHSIRAISIDMAPAYEKAVGEALPDAEVCWDPFHVVAGAGLAIDQVRRQERNPRVSPEPRMVAGSSTPAGR
jgi:hypothetical protein